VGEDGPTHEPIEQIAMLRTIPGLTVYRPAEAHEVAHCYAASLKAKGPSVILCTRQDLRPYTPEQAAKIDVAKGAYVISDDADADLIFIATGSEVNLALDAAEIARANGAKVRVVSMVSMENFFAQDNEYRDSVLPPSVKKRVSIEAASTFGWAKVVGDEGLSIGLDHFGASAPYKALAEEFGFTPEKVIAAVKAHFTVCKNGCCSCCC
jgi:transketolase